MADNSAIEWTDASYNPIRARNLKTGKIGWHCEHSTTGCEFCYSEGFNLRLGTGLPYKPGHRKDVEIFLDENTLRQPLRWKRPRMIFVCSMTDLFADFVLDGWINAMLAVMALCPQHTFQILTKRSERMLHHLRNTSNVEDIYAAACSKDPTLADRWVWPLPNVWLGISAERQPEADERVIHLLNAPAAVRFVSAEPLVSAVDFSRVCLQRQKPGSVRAGIHVNSLAGRYCESGVSYTGEWDVTKPAPNIPAIHLDWIIVGGESGRNARPFNIEWADAIVAQCRAAKVACFVKQFGDNPLSDGHRLRLNARKGGDPAEWPESLRLREFPGGPVQGALAL